MFDGAALRIGSFLRPDVVSDIEHTNNTGSYFDSSASDPFSLRVT